MVAFNGFLFGFGAGDYGIATGEEEDAGRGIVESTSGTRENFGIVWNLCPVFICIGRQV